MELSDRLLKVLQVTGTGADRKITFLKAAELDETEPGEISGKLVPLLKGLPYPSERVFASLSRSQMTTRILSLPSTETAELDKMVGFQLEKELPFPKDKIIIDYVPLETTPEGFTRLLLVVVGEDLVHRSLAILKQGGLIPEALFFSSEGVAASWQMSRKEETAESCVALVDLDRFLTHVEVIQGGKLRMTRSFLTGARHLNVPEPKAAEETFLQELNRTFVAFRKESPPGKIDKLVLSGGEEGLMLVQKYLAPRIGLPVEILDFKGICPFESETVKEALEGDLSFVSGVGLLLKEGQRINLIPPSLKKARMVRQVRQMVFQSAFLLLGVLALVGFLFGSSLRQQQHQLVMLQEQLKTIEPDTARLETMQKQLQFLERRKTESEAILEILRELYRIIPQDASLTYLVIEPDHLSLRGRSSVLATVFQFAEALEESPFFQSVRVNNATRRTLSEGEVALFQLDAAVLFSEEEK